MGSSRLLRERKPYHPKAHWLNGLNSLLVRLRGVGLGQGSRVVRLPEHQNTEQVQKLDPACRSCHIFSTKGISTSQQFVCHLSLSASFTFTSHLISLSRSHICQGRGGGSSGVLHTKAKRVQVKQLYRYLFISYHLWLRRCLWSFSSSWLFPFSSIKA